MGIAEGAGVVHDKIPPALCSVASVARKLARSPGKRLDARYPCLRAQQVHGACVAQTVAQVNVARLVRAYQVGQPVLARPVAGMRWWVERYKKYLSSRLFDAFVIFRELRNVVRARYSAKVPLKDNQRAPGPQVAKCERPTTWRVQFEVGRTLSHGWLRVCCLFFIYHGKTLSV
jgi:hypothetical protein